MSVPIGRACCAKTGRTVLINSLSKGPDTGQSNWQFSKNPNKMSRDEWNFIRNFGHEMYKNYLLMRSLKKDTTCTSRLSQGLRPAIAEKPVPEKTAKKAVKKARLKVLPSIPFIHNFDFLKKLNCVVGAGAGAGQVNRSLKAQQLRTYEDSSGGKLRVAAKYPKIATTTFQPIYRLPTSEAPVNTASLVLDRRPGVGRVHANWFGHDIGYKLAPETGVIALDFVTSPTAALAGQRNETLESKVPKRYFKSKTSPKTKIPREVGFVSKHRAFGSSLYSDEKERNLRYYNDLMRMESFRRQRADMLKYGIAPGMMRGFGLPMYTGEALYDLRYVEDDQIQSPRTQHGNGIPRDLGHFTDPDSLRYATYPRQNYWNPADGNVDGSNSVFPLQNKTPITAACFDNKAAYKDLIDIGLLPQANVKGTVDGLQSAKTKSVGGLDSGRHSKYIPFVEFPRQALRSDLANMETYRYLRHFGVPLHGNIAIGGKGLRKFENSNYLGHTADVQRDFMVSDAEMYGNAMPAKYLLYEGDSRKMEKLGNYRQFLEPRQSAVVGTTDLYYVNEFDYPNRTVDSRLVDMMGPAYGMGDAEANQYLKYTGDPSDEFARRKFTSHTQANTPAPAEASKYIGNSGYLRENRVRRRRKVGPFANKKFARYPGQTGVPGIVGTIGGHESFEIIKRPSIHLRPSQAVRRETGLMIQEPPRYMRHTLIPRRGDSSGIEADLAYIRESRLPKQYKIAAQGSLTYTKFPSDVGRSFGTLPADFRNFEARKSIRHSLFPFTRTSRVGSFPGYNFRDPRFSRYSTPLRQGTINDFRYSEADKTMKGSRMSFQRPSHLDYIRVSTSARQPMGRRRKIARDPFDYPYGGRPNRNTKIDTLRGKPLQKSDKTVDEERKVNMQRFTEFLAQEQEGYVYDPGYTGHIHPFYSGFIGNNYGLNELHQLNSALLSTEEQRERDKARLKSLNLFYNIINIPDMEMEILVPEDTTGSFDYNTAAKLAHIEEKKLSLIDVVKLLKSGRKKKFLPVVFHEPFDKEKPWTWIQNFPIRIPNEVLKRLSAHSLQTFKTWQRQQALMWEKFEDQIPPTLKRDKKRRSGSN